MFYNTCIIEVLRSKIAFIPCYKNIKIMKQKLFYCQSQIEDKNKCITQCEHCKEYYKPLEK